MVSLCVLTHSHTRTHTNTALPLLPLPPNPQSRLPLISRHAAVILPKIGFSFKQTATLLSCDPHTVSRWSHAYDNTGDVKDKQHTGRPRLSDENTDINIAVTARVERFTTPKRVKRQLDLDVSTRTVRRRLNEAGLFGRLARKERQYTESQLNSRLSFAHQYKHWTKEQWERVVFCDEVHITVGAHGQVWVQRPPSHAYDPQYEYQDIQPLTEQSIDDRTMVVWCCFYAHDYGTVQHINGSFTGKQYADILRNSLLPCIKRWFTDQAMNNHDWWLLQDNLGVHTAPPVHRFLHTQCWQLLDFPPYSPDLNPIENLFFIVKRQVEEANPSTTDEAWNALSHVWTHLDTDYLCKLAHSMPARCAEVISNKGHKTHY